MTESKTETATIEITRNDYEQALARMVDDNRRELDEAREHVAKIGKLRDAAIDIGLAAEAKALDRQMMAEGEQIIHQSRIQLTLQYRLQESRKGSGIV